tara:strand:- start:179 stop:679 length:501 start_codon:yes stop_codon:yes gene_type:complete
MALSNKITSIEIRQKDFDSSNDWKYKFTINNMVADIGQVNFNSAFDEAIDGTLRSNLRGYRVSVSLSFEKLLSSTVQRQTQGNQSYASSTVSAFLGDLVSALVTTGDSHIEISLSDGTPNFFAVIPKNLRLVTAYKNQIGRGSANLDFIGRSILTTIPAYLQAPSV